MRFLLRPQNLLVLASYLVLSAVPFLPAFFGKTPDDVWRLLAMEFVSWLALWAVFKRPGYFHWALAPAFLALPVYLYLQVYFGQGISTHHLGIIAETSPKEALEFLGNKIWLLGLIFIMILAWFALTWRAAWRTRDLDWTDSSRWVILAMLAVCALVWTYGHQVGVTEPASDVQIADEETADDTDGADEAEDREKKEAEKADGAAPESGVPSSPAAPAKSIKLTGASALSSALSSAPPLPDWAWIPFDTTLFGKSWPFGLVVHGYDFWKERQYLADLAEKSRAFRFGARQERGVDTPQIVVMVIGESSRFDRWSLNGYRRETNPLLRAEPNLVSLTDMITPVSATRLSVPVIISRKPATQSLKAGFSEKSFLSAFKEAGFRTYWLSNQMSFGKFDTPISVFAKEADVVQFVNLGGFTDQSSFDQVLLDPLRVAIDDAAPKKLIVLHTLGNHWNYSHRHPASFDKWKPSLFGIENPAYTDLRLKTQLNNSYDNSILYTDWFLSQVVGRLKSSGHLASMLYVADHGQTLYDGSCTIAFHGHNTRHEFHIPALVWYSDAYREIYPDKVTRLLRNRRARLSTENVFHTLVDMADIRYPSEKLERSFLHRKFRTHRRYVDSYGWTDYDNARFKGDCKEVIDKGRPLSQEH